jgi:hypothetical protein
MDSSDKFKSTLAFIDLLFNVLVGFVFLFIIAFILINPITKKDNIIVPAEIMIVLKWPDGIDVDMDLWVKDPANNVVGYRHVNGGIMHLDRDDLGMKSESVIVDDKEIVMTLNREVITLRGIVPGEYKISVHYYRDGEKDSQVAVIPVTVEVTKINPYSVIFSQTINYDSEGQTKNFYKFELNAQGRVINVGNSLDNVVPLDSVGSPQPPGP